MKPKYEKNEKKYRENRVTRRKSVMNMFYLVSLLIIFEVIGVGLLIFPRSSVSELEKRELEKFPELSQESYFSGEFTEGVTEWFSDTVPFRDDLMELSASIRELNGFRKDDIKIHGVGEVIVPEEKPTVTSKPETEEAPTEETVSVTGETSAAETSEQNTQETAEPQQTTATGNSQIEEPEDSGEEAGGAVEFKNNGVVVIGDGSDTRALMLYGGNYNVGEAYAKVINKYKKKLGDGVNVYSMIIPTAAEFYSPPEVKPYTASQLDNINWVIENLSDDVRAVDVYTALSQHTDENIYTRTDHHWASLGAYYAAQEFAKVADVPFMDISQYEQKVVHDYVGTMYTYSEYDPKLKNNPEDFFYYVPKDVDYTTTYTEYILGEGNAIEGMRDPFEGSYFIKYSDGNSMAYCTFMGGDSKITHIKTSTENGRKLAIFKDSYGNALPSFLFGSFEEITVIDMRFFTYNAVDYLTENGITDVLFANNAFHAATASTVKYYENFLKQ